MHPLNTSSLCALCHRPLLNLVHCLEESEGEVVFCCKGCQVVYQILKAQHALANFQEHPVYQQALKAGLIAAPLQFVKDEENKVPEEQFEKLHLVIENMWCPSCAQVIHFILMKEKGIRQCMVDYATDLAAIEYTPRFISKEKILRLIQQLGYQPHFLQDPRQKTLSHSLILRFVIAVFFSLNVMMFAYPIYATYFEGAEEEGYAQLFAWLSFVGSLPVLLYSGWPIWRRCYTGLSVGIWGMETLVSMGVAAATGLSLYELFLGSPYVYFDSVTVIIMFVLLGKILESKAKFSAKDALVKLSLALPRKGRKRLATGEEVFLPIKDILPGDLLVVWMGEKIILDGKVEEGTGACDESLMTGESLPVAKQKGANVLAGTVLCQGYLLIRVSLSLEETLLQRIVNVISQDVKHKPKYVRAVDPIARSFIPFVIILAFITAGACLFWGIADEGQSVLQTALIRASALLLISCPCAIGIAAPLAEAHLLNALAKVGILVRNRGALPFLGKETLFIFDKTGTVTEGRFRVYAGLDTLTLLEKQALKGIVSQSTHPIAVALHMALSCPASNFETLEERVGQGIQGTLYNQRYYLGSAAFFAQLRIAIPFTQNPKSASSILTTVYFAKEDICLTAITLGDQVRPGVQEFIQHLFPTRTLLVSGDAESPVAEVATLCRFSAWKWGCHPLEKKELVDRLKSEGEIVAMFGDGINDAPALTTAHIGIAMVSASDISIQVSDLLVTTSHFRTLSFLRQIAIKGQRIVKQNLFWAFFYNCIGIGFAASGMLNPLLAAVAMIVSSTMVLLNAQRLSSMALDP